MKLNEMTVKDGAIVREDFEKFVDEHGLTPSECIELEEKLPVEPVNYDLSCEFDNTPKGDLNAFKVYKAEVMKIPYLSRAEEKELCRIMKRNQPKGGEEPNLNYVNARNKLVEHNLALGIWYAKKYMSQTTGSMDFLDLIQECNQGLIFAAENFDAEKSKFSTYAYYALRTSVTKAVAKYAYAFRTPDTLPARFSKLKKVQDILEEELDFVRTPTIEEVVERYNKMYAGNKISVKVAKEIFGLYPLAMSLDIVSGTDRDDNDTSSTMSRGDMIPDMKNTPEENSVMLDFGRTAKALLYSELTEKERRAFLLRYGTNFDKEESFNVVADRMGISKQAATKLCHNAEDKLARALEQRGLAEYMSGRI